jgi:hypothetical protein
MPVCRSIDGRPRRRGAGCQWKAVDGSRLHAFCFWLALCRRHDRAGSPMTEWLRPIGAVVLLLLTTTPAIPRELPSITDRSGRLEYRLVDGQVTILPIDCTFQSPTLSIDGRSIAYICVLKSQTPDDDGAAELWIADGPPVGRIAFLALIPPRIQSITCGGLMDRCSRWAGKQSIFRRELGEQKQLYTESILRPGRHGSLPTAP